MGKTSKMKAALIVTAVWMCSCAVLEGADRGFDDIVRAISNQFHTRPLHIPFFGLVNVATFVAHPDDHSAGDLAEAIRRADGDRLPFVRVRGHAETILVYMAEERGDCRLLVLTVEAGEVTVVELKLNPKAIEAWLREPIGKANRVEPNSETRSESLLAPRG